MNNESDQKMPECRLWTAVICLAVDDLFKGRGIDAADAKNFLFGNSRWLYQICDMAAVDYLWLKRKIYEVMSDPNKSYKMRYFTKKLYPPTPKIKKKKK